MRVFLDFKCPSGHIEEHFVDNLTKTHSCDRCGQEATKIQSTIRFKLDIVSGHFPSATDKWAKNRRLKLKEEQRLEAINGID